MHKNIKDFVVGEKASGVYIVTSHSIKPTKTNSNYLDINIQDKTGTINGKMWTIPANFDVNGIVDGGFIVLAFTVEEYLGKKQIKIDNIRLVDETVRFDKSELIPTAPRPADEMYSDILCTINEIQNEELQELCMNVIMENSGPLKVYPAARGMHHAEIGGLLHHVTGMLKLAKAILPLYPHVSRDLLLSGIILHDICKIREFALGPVGLCTDYSAEGKLLGHITMGCSYIEAKCRELNISDNVRMAIMHMLLSHHGKPEYGSAIQPMFIEAFLLNEIDDLDAKMNMTDGIMENVPVGGFSDKVLGLGNICLYNHGIK